MISISHLSFKELVKLLVHRGLDSLHMALQVVGVIVQRVESVVQLGQDSLHAVRGEFGPTQCSHLTIWVHKYRVILIIKDSTRRLGH